jgi:ribosomal protein L11 methyltransferase
MQSFIQVVIKVDDESVKEQLIALLSLIKFEGFEEKDNTLIAYADEASFNEVEIEAMCKQFDLEFSTSIIPQQNWNALWESNFEPVVVDDFCAIRADFHQPIPNIEHDIIITPKMSFGTGHHATTYLMIKQMRDIDFENKSVADFGTGTGILAIMAEKLGASKIVAIDYDDWSIENTTENLERNNCSRIEILKADNFSSSYTFDIILANINKNVIVDNLKSLTNGLSKGGKLLLSGLLKSDETEVITAFEAMGMKWMGTEERNNWITILLTV